jgi:RNA polymerase sigma factor (sigma-70 family)
VTITKPFPETSATQIPDNGAVEAAMPEDTPDTPSWASLVAKIRSDDPAGMEELYRVFSRGIRFYLWRQLGVQDLDDRLHDTFLIVAQAIRRGDLREPERLMGFVRTVVRRQVAAHIDAAVQSRRHETAIDVGFDIRDTDKNPEHQAIDKESKGIALRILRSLPQRDREILIRFYLHEQRPEQICQDMNLTETQFRLIKSRAKARFGELGKRRMARRGVTIPS